MLIEVSNKNKVLMKINKRNDEYFVPMQTTKLNNINYNNALIKLTNSTDGTKVIEIE